MPTCKIYYSKTRGRENECFPCSSFSFHHLAIFDNFRGQVLQFWGEGRGAMWPVKAFAFAWLFFESGDASIRWVDLFIISSFFLFHFSFSKLFSFLFADAFSWIFSPFPPFRYSVRRVRISRWMREGLNVFVFLVLLRRDTMLITQSLFMEV